MYAANQSLHRGVTLEKLQRDAQNIRQYARFVIVLNGQQVEVIDNGHLRKEKLPYAKLVAVLGPVEHKGVSLKESVLMEIGYSRTRPYAQLEERPKDKNGDRSGRRWFLKGRARVGNLSDKDFSLVYPIVAQCMEQIVLECRENWGTKGPWYVNGPGEIERGIYFTVSHSDELLYRQLVCEDVRYRKQKYIVDHAVWIRSLLGKYKSSYYTAKQLKGFAKARIVAELLSQRHYTPFYRAVLLSCLTAGSHVRILFESIIEIFNIDISLTDQEAYALERDRHLPWLKNLRCYRPPIQPSVHAQGSSVFEIILERNYREQNEVPF